jgi:uncharacterized alpha-E superfamily protein
LSGLFRSLEKKEAELRQVAAQAKAVGEENGRLSERLRSVEGCGKVEVEVERERLAKVAQTCEDLENELIDVQFSKESATRRVEELEAKLR